MLVVRETKPPKPKQTTPLKLQKVLKCLDAFNNINYIYFLIYIFFSPFFFHQHQSEMLHAAFLHIVFHSPRHCPSLSTSSF